MRQQEHRQYLSTLTGIMNTGGADRNWVQNVLSHLPAYFQIWSLITFQYHLSNLVYSVWLNSHCEVQFWCSPESRHFYQLGWRLSNLRIILLDQAVIELFQFIAFALVHFPIWHLSNSGPHTRCGTTIRILLLLE